MSDMKKGLEENRPLEPRIVLDLSAAPAHASFSRHLTFQNHRGQNKRLLVEFRKTGTLRWEAGAFPEGIDSLRSLADTGNRCYWDRLFLENRGGRTTLAIHRLQVVMRYQNPPGLSPAGIDHAAIPIVDWTIGMQLLAGDDGICLDEFARRSRFSWAGMADTDPLFLRMVAEDLGKSGSDGGGQDQYGSNPKYGGAIDMLCSEIGRAHV